MKTNKKYYWEWTLIESMIRVAKNNLSSTIEYEFDNVEEGDNFRIFIENNILSVCFNSQEIWQENVDDFDGESVDVLIEIVEGRRAPFGDFIEERSDS